MLLSEYTSKEIIRQFGVAIPEGRLARSAAEAEDRCRQIKAEKFVVKAQIAAGGCGLGWVFRWPVHERPRQEEWR